jgi:Holliday junction resolvasome RuvABC DNA-binding subunit
MVEGNATDLVFRHADGTPYGARVTSATTDAYQAVFAALRNLGFREREARGVISELRHEGTDPRVEPLLRAALARLSRAAA